ncbi:hypothetical protein O9H85_06635 [Paenibacillus filicis]|uniref:DUF4044 domain-containing protein n=1 Tax=Paenibacillus gyeongsangnamensis TaxID=3388067 RepID=A0ABT4Q5P1_9BACL|nr:hypothetical protein [Paenibacillus filicis]MCZ8512107.1 hypothetical protein [Paenibacillus filicis]
MHKNKPTYLKRRTKDEPNKKLIIWVSSIFAVLVVLMAALLIFNR